jgi:hypothetical protein
MHYIFTMSTNTPTGIVKKAKDDLQKLFDKIPVSEQTDSVYIIIKECVTKFFERTSYNFGNNGSYEGWQYIPMEDKEAIQLFKSVIPLLEQTSRYISEDSSYHKDFQKLQKFIDNWFGGGAQPPSNPLPQTQEQSENSAYDKVLDLQSETVRLELKIKEIESSHAGYEHERISWEEKIKKLEQEMKKFHTVLQRLNTLEATVKKLSTQPSNLSETPIKATTPEQRKRIFGIFAEQPKQVSIDTLLQKMSNLETDV